jgi:hypothetical protein
MKQPSLNYVRGWTVRLRVGTTTNTMLRRLSNRTSKEQNCLQGCVHYMKRDLIKACALYFQRVMALHAVKLLSTGYKVEQSPLAFKLKSATSKSVCHVIRQWYTLTVRHVFHFVSRGETPACYGDLHMHAECCHRQVPGLAAHLALFLS